MNKYARLGWGVDGIVQAGSMEHAKLTKLTEDFMLTLVPPLAPKQLECPLCREIHEKRKGFGPSHQGSPHCMSGSLASGGTHAHCTCDTCF